MKVTAGSWQQGISGSLYRTAQQEREKEAEAGVEMQKAAAQNGLSKAGSGQAAGSPSSGKVRASLPDDSVGELAALLARAETKLDVHQVSSKVMRGLANLRMSAALCEGKDKEKANKMIRRMEKLLKRVYKKLKQLGKEEQLEQQREKAEKKMEDQKAEELRDELKCRRNKRRREEREYAMKENAEDHKAAAADGSLLPGGDAGSVPSSSELPAMAGSGGAAAPVSAVAEAFSSADAAVEGASLDMTV